MLFLRLTQLSERLSGRRETSPNRTIHIYIVATRCTATYRLVWYELIKPSKERSFAQRPNAKHTNRVSYIQRIILHVAQRHFLGHTTYFVLLAGGGQHTKSNKVNASDMAYFALDGF